MLHYFRGIEVSGLQDGSFRVSQTKYINDLLHRAKMLQSKHHPSPMVSSVIVDGFTPIEDPMLYRLIVGAL